MSKSIIKGFAVGRVDGTPVFKASLVPDMAPVKFLNLDMLTTLTKQAENLTKIGLGKVAEVILKELPRDLDSIFAPQKKVLNGLTIPLTQQTLLQILFDSYFGHDFNQRLTWAKIYLTIAGAESGFNPLAKSSTTTASGQLQVIDAAKKPFYEIGQHMVEASPVLTVALKLHEGINKKQAYVKQVLINLGAMASLKNAIYNQWSWDGSKGWTFNSDKPHPLVAQVKKEFPNILKSEELGIQLLASIYHINGLNVFRTSGTSLHHHERYATDVLDHYKMSRVPGFSTLLLKYLPGKVSNLLVHQAGVESGDPSDDIVHINDFMGSLLEVPYKWHPDGSGIITSKWGKKRTITDSSTGETTTAIHNGVDLAAKIGQPVFALSDGVVSSSSDAGDKDFGKSIWVKDIVKGGTIIYGHNSLLFIDKGASVKKGDMIALSGASGKADGPHVHIEFRPFSNKKISPESVGLDPVWSVNKKGV